MGAGALFHQTSLFRICREANFSKCYRNGIGVRLDTDGLRLLGFPTTTTTTISLLLQLLSETQFYQLSGRMKTEGSIRISAHNVGMEFKDLFGSVEE